MKVKAIIQNHYKERLPNVKIMVEDLLKNGLTLEDIVILTDNPELKYPYQSVRSSFKLPINVWHGIGVMLDADYIALLCDDLTLRPNSIHELKYRAESTQSIQVFGFEGGQFDASDKPYSGGEPSHTAEKFERADYLIRFYFASRQALSNATKAYTSSLPKYLLQHDDLILSLTNRCALVPTTPMCGWNELPTYGVGFCHRPTHYDERNALINLYQA